MKGSPILEVQIGGGRGKRSSPRLRPRRTPSIRSSTATELISASWIVLAASTFGPTRMASGMTICWRCQSVRPAKPGIEKQLDASFALTARLSFGEAGLLSFPGMTVPGLFDSNSMDAQKRREWGEEGFWGISNLQFLPPEPRAAQRWLPAFSRAVSRPRYARCGQFPSRRSARNRFA
jgi:hypothetical protein